MIALSEAEILKKLTEGISFFPAHLSWKTGTVTAQARPGNAIAGGIVYATWGEGRAEFLLEYKRLNTPKIFELALMQLRSYTAQNGSLPLLMMPYLSDAQLKRLEQESMSGIDLCGNGVLIAPGFRVWRSGQPNKFRSSQPIKNVYRGVSSLIARCFLLCSGFPSLMDLTEYAGMRQMEDADVFVSRNSLTKATVSKVVSALVDELIVMRYGAELRLKDPVRLMDRLRANYVPITGRTIIGKTSLTDAGIWDALWAKREADRSFRYSATGSGSAEKYRVLSGAGPLSLYISNYDEIGHTLNVQQSRVFPNIKLIETASDIAYFDARGDEHAIWASPVQAWLELSNGGPREREAAESIAPLLTKPEGEVI